jgi:5-methyltetrahydrofolate--homocysteine methyltransferase
MKEESKVAETLQDLRDSIVNGKRKDAVALTQALLAAGLRPRQILDEGLIEGMNEVGNRFKRGEYFVPEMLIAARAMKEALEILRPKLVGVEAKPVGTVVIGTVYGDLHDIGKNLTAMFLEGAGFKVIDLGVDVPAEKFVEAVRTHQAEIVAMSALLTTTMIYTINVIKALEREKLRDKVKVIVGGAPVTAEWAKHIGADGFAFDAASGADQCRAFLRQAA